MYAGKVVETTETSALYANPRHPYTEALLPRAAGEVGGDRERLYSIPGAPPDLVNPPPGCRFAPRCRYAPDKCRAECTRAAAGETTAHTYACFYPVGAQEKTVGGQLTVVEPLAEARAPQAVEDARSATSVLLAPGTWSRISR